MAAANSTGNADSNGDIKNSREFRSSNQMASTVGIGNSAVSAVSSGNLQQQNTFYSIL